MELEDEAHLGVAKRHARLIGHGAEIVTVYGDAARVGAIEAAQQVQQRALADAARADDGQHLPALDDQIEIAEHVDVLRADAVALVQG